jgi:hypothetical protein
MVYVDRRPRIEAVAMEVARQYEAQEGRHAEDVTRRPGAPPIRAQVHETVRAAAPQLRRWSGDLFSADDSSWRLVEVKGRSLRGPVQGLLDREYRTGLALGERYWLYVVFNCRTDEPYLTIIQNPMCLPWSCSCEARPAEDVAGMHIAAREAEFTLDLDVIDRVGERVWPQ